MQRDDVDLLLLQPNYEEPRVRLKPLGPLLINLAPQQAMLVLKKYSSVTEFLYKRICIISKSA